jgi:hypothetical protein
VARLFSTRGRTEIWDRTGSQFDFESEQYGVGSAGFTQTWVVAGGAGMLSDGKSIGIFWLAMDGRRAGSKRQVERVATSS